MSGSPHHPEGRAIYLASENSGRIVPGYISPLAYYWGHWPRELLGIDDNGNAPIVSEVLRRIGQLYAIEGRNRGPTAYELCVARQAETRPLVNALKPWIEGV